MYLVAFWQREIWLTHHLADNSVRGWLYAFLRTVSISITVFVETKAASRAAALSFSSLLGLGPLLTIGVLVGGFVLGANQNPTLVASKVNELIHFVAPQMSTFENLDKEPAAPELSAGDASKPANPAPAPALKPELIDLINNIITRARSGSAGVVGAFSLIILVLLLFKTVEDAFNDIWGVRTGRSVFMRVVFYWTILTLGAVVFFAAMTLLGASAFVNVFNTSIARLPGGLELLALLRWSLPAFSFVLIVVLLSIFYRVIPNTPVLWRAAFAGAVVVAALLMLNNFVTFLYVRRVVLEHSLYGSLAILPVLMFGLYIFWLYVLIGGIISYAVQNAHFRNSQAAWSTLTESMRERLSLVVLLTVCRRFHACLPPMSATQLGTLVKAPTQFLNACLNRLVDMNLVTALRPVAGTPAGDFLYQPARPLSRITLYEFKRLDDNLGDDPMGHALDRIDPLLHQYDETLAGVGEQKFFQKSLEELFSEHAFEDTRAAATAPSKSAA